LIEASWIKTVLRSRIYPSLLQWITTGAFVLVLALALFGPNNAGQNFGMALVWLVWWPLLPLSFLLAGRSWCAVCPFACLMDRVQQGVGVRLPAPLFLRRHGPWMIAVMFVLVTYVDEVWGIHSNARSTGYLLLVVLALAVFFGAFFERRTFCRYVCFIGGIAANYSRAGVIQLRAEPDRCRDCVAQPCYHGAQDTPGCPVFLSPPSLQDSAMCHLCGNCVKNCGPDAIRVSLRRPTVELWENRRPHLSAAVLAAAVIGIVMIEQSALLRSWNPLLDGTGRMLHIDPYVYYPLVYAVLLATFMAAPLIGLMLAAFLSSLGFRSVSRSAPARVLENFATFGSALIPLALAGHVAHGLYHLLTRSRSVPFAFLAMMKWFPGSAGAAWLPNSVVFLVEMAVLISGAASSVWVADRLSRRLIARVSWAACLPHAILLLALLAANLYTVSAMLTQMR